MRDHDFERELDAALAKYGAAEPRAGLEQRVLANLRTERASDVRRSWLRPAGALATAVVIAAILLGWRVHSRTNVTAVPVAAQQAARPSEAGKVTDAVNGRGERLIARRTTKRGTVRREAESAALPRLDQFPAPEPLSEQEKLLIRFVTDDPREAALVAQATAEEMQQESDAMKDSQVQ
jgi:hypothetical protein